MENKKMYITLAAVVLSCISLAPLIVVGEVEYGSECSISNVAPLIAESHFSLSSAESILKSKPYTDNKYRRSSDKCVYTRDRHDQ